MKTRIVIIIALTIIAVALLIGFRVRKHINNKPMVQTDTTLIAKRVLNLIILDESGSMRGLERTSVDGVNETIQTIKGSYEQFPEQNQLLTFITFSSRGDSDYRTQFNLCHISKVEEFNYSNYVPNGGTPLYDTMGKALTELEKEATDSDIVLVTIITDGYENSSYEYNQESIKALISRLDEKDWVFTYIGANQDAILEAGKMGIRNAMNYDANVDGTREMWEREKKYRSSFLDGARIGVSKKRLKSDYFVDKEEK
jgi:uncharacterized protein YegL